MHANAVLLIAKKNLNRAYSSIDSNSTNDSGSTITLGQSDQNNGTIELIGTGGNGVDNVVGVNIDSRQNTIDSGGELIIEGTAGVDNKQNTWGSLP